MSDIVWKCCCKRGTITDTCRRKTLFETEVDENEHCIYCGTHAFADFEGNTRSMHVKIRSERDRMRDLAENDGINYLFISDYCDAMDRVDLYGRWNGKPLAPDKY